MLPLRLVLDTNVVISGALKPQGLERAVVTLASTLPALWFVTGEILAEYEEVLARPELRIPVLERRGLMDLIRDRAQRVVPVRALDACRDPDDNIFVECAEAARADYLITGNTKHFPKYWGVTKVIGSRELLDIIGPHL